MLEEHLTFFGLVFGDMIQINRRGRTQETPEYALHIQCSWRITLDYTIVVASEISIS